MADFIQVDSLVAMMRTRQKLVMAELDLDRSDQFPKRGLGRHTDGSDLRGLRLEA